MKTPKLAALATTALISAGGLWAAGAFAQQPQTQPPLQQPPSVSQPQPPSTTTTPSADNAATQRTGAQMQADMATRFLARAKSALQLTAEQEKQWPAVEQAIRDGVRRRADLMERFRAQGEASDPVQRMRRMSELFAARSESFSKIADAVQPLYASLSDDQKQRLRRVMPGADGRMAMHDGGRRQDERRGDRFERFHEEMMRHWRGNGGGMFGMPGMGGRDDRDHDRPGMRREWRDERYGDRRGMGPDSRDGQRGMGRDRDYDRPGMRRDWQDERFGGRRGMEHDQDYGRPRGGMGRDREFDHRGMPGMRGRDRDDNAGRGMGPGRDDERFAPRGWRDDRPMPRGDFRGWRDRDGYDRM